MQGDDQHDVKSNMPLKIWAACVGFLLGPSILVWIVRAVAMAARCAPGPQLCHGIALGGGLRDSLNLAWTIGGNSTFLITIALVATIAGLMARRPLLAAITLLLLPLAVLMLPMAAVYSAKYTGCYVNESGIGDCALWGAQMGMSFHAAADVSWQIYGFAPYSFALALMLGLLGWFFVRPRSVPHATAHARRIHHERFTHRDPNN
jgi:hypothetical protein